MYLFTTYGLVYVCVILVLYIIALVGAWDNQFSFVPHHYFVALFLIPITRFLNPVSAFIQALLVGVFVEGVARWNFTWIFHWNNHQRWLLLYMQWLKRGGENEDEDEMVGAQVLGRFF